MLKKEQIEYLDDIPFNQFRYNTQQNVFERNALGKDEVGNIIEEIEQLSLVFDKDILTFTLKRVREWVEKTFVHDFPIREDYVKPEYKIFFDHLSDFTKTISEYVKDSNIDKLNTVFNELKYNTADLVAKEIIKLPLNDVKLNLDSGDLEYTAKLGNETVMVEVSVWEDTYYLYIHTDKGTYSVNRIDVTKDIRKNLDDYVYHLLSDFDGKVYGVDFTELMDMIKRGY